MFGWLRRQKARMPGVGLRFTSEGKLWFCTTVLLLAVGIGKNINLVALLGFAMLAVLVLCVFAVGTRLARIEAARRLPELVFAQQQTPYRLRVANSSTRTIPGPCIFDGGVGKDWYLDALAGRETRVCCGELKFPTRGRQELPSLVATSSYPFGLVRRGVAVGGAESVVVLPWPERVNRDHLRKQLRGADPLGDRVQRHGWRHETAQADFHGIRPFRPGDSPRWIHWRTTARRGEVMVREFEDAPGEDLALVLDVRGAPGELFEEAVTVTASLIWEWCKRRGDRLMLVVNGPNGGVYDGTTGPAHARELLSVLALVSACVPESTDPPSLTAAMPAGMGIVVLTTLGEESAEEIQGELGKVVTLLDVHLWREWEWYRREGQGLASVAERV